MLIANLYCCNSVIKRNSLSSKGGKNFYFLKQLFMSWRCILFVFTDAIPFYLVSFTLSVNVNICISWAASVLTLKAIFVFLWQLSLYYPCVTWSILVVYLLSFDWVFLGVSRWDLLFTLSMFRIIFVGDKLESYFVIVLAYQQRITKKLIM